MTCFWDGIISSLDINDYKKIGIDKKPSPRDFVINLKKHNIKTSNVLWCNNKITDKQLGENYEAINNYDIKTINKGYFCSTFDPFLFLISEIFKLNIQHCYLKNTINYKNINNIKNIKYKSNKNHFSVAK